MPAHPITSTLLPQRHFGQERPPAYEEPQPSLPLTPPSREQATHAHTRYLARGGRLQADLKLVKFQDILWVIKDFSCRAWWVRWTIGLWLIHRELSCLRRLKGIEGIPQAAARIDRFAFAYPYVQATSLNRIPPRDLSADFFNAYESLLEEMHARGVVHLNLASGANVLVTPGQRPVLIDFQAHVAFPRWLSHLGQHLGQLDFMSFNTFWNRYLLEQFRREERRDAASRSG